MRSLLCSNMLMWHYIIWRVRWSDTRVDPTHESDSAVSRVGAFWCRVVQPWVKDVLYNHSAAYRIMLVATNRQTLLVVP